MRFAQDYRLDTVIPAQNVALHGWDIESLPEGSDLWTLVLKA